LGQHGQQASAGIRLVIAALGYGKVASRIDGKSLGRIMGLKWIATLKVEFEILDGRPDSLALAQTVLAREVGLLKHNTEHGRELDATGAKPKSAKIQILSQGPAHD
jgi:hypothetical protein